MILLDTHIWLRWLKGTGERIPPTLLQRLEATDGLAVSVMSCWEVAMLVKAGRVALDRPVRDWLVFALRESGTRCLGVTPEIAVAAAELPQHHRDPIDRMLIATALIEDIELASLDGKFPLYRAVGLRLLDG